MWFCLLFPSKPSQKGYIPKRPHPSLIICTVHWGARQALHPIGIPVGLTACACVLPASRVPPHSDAPAEALSDVLLFDYFDETEVLGYASV